MTKSLASVGTFLDSHSKRDTVIRTAQFGALLLGGLSRNYLPSLSENMIKVCSEFSHARLILRLIDDVPMLAHTLKCYLSREVRVHRCVGVCVVSPSKTLIDSRTLSLVVVRLWACETIAHACYVCAYVCLNCLSLVYINEISLVNQMNFSCEVDKGPMS